MRIPVCIEFSEKKILDFFRRHICSSANCCFSRLFLERSRARTDRVPSSSQSGRRGWCAATITALVFSTGPYASNNTTAYILVGDAKQSIGDDAEQNSTSNVQRFATTEIQQMERHDSVTTHDVSGIPITFSVRNTYCVIVVMLTARNKTLVLIIASFISQSDVQQSTAVSVQSGRIILA